MSKLSVTGVGLIVMTVSVILKWAGMDVDEGQITEVVNAGVTIFAFVMMVYGQYRRTDLVGGLIRKSS